MTSLRYEDVEPGAALFLALVRGRFRFGATPAIGEAAAAAAARPLPRDALAESIVARLRALDAPPESVAAAQRLREPGVVAVLAGQQPVLFGGPHFVLSKALTAVAAARALEASGRPAVPVFWAASEDHDHAEVDHVDVLDDDGLPQRLSVALPGDRRMLSRVPLPEATTATVARLTSLLPDGPGRDAAVAAATPRAGDDVGSAFCRTLLGTVGRLGVVVVEPETLRPFAREVVRHDVLHPGALAAEVVRAEDAAAAAGFERPLGLRAREIFFVVDREGRRHRPQGLPAGDDERGRAKWLGRLDSRPDGFSWDVAGRILAQSAALPVAAQVCGPSELAYASAVAPAFALLGLPAPALLPRRGLTYVDARAAAACREAGVAPADVVRGAVAPPPGGASLRPGGALQERVASALPWISRHGSGIVERSLEAIAGPEAEHALVETGGA